MTPRPGKHLAPTAAQRRESRARQAAINATDPALIAREFCWFD